MSKTDLTDCGELRNLLAESIVLVKEGTMASGTANDIGKLAGRLNDNYFAEVAVRRQLSSEGRKLSEFGKLAIRTDVT